MSGMVLVMQGQSGSGKSTLAETFKSWFEALGFEVDICSTDDQFKIDGVYKFDPSKLAQAHAANVKKAEFGLDWGRVVIIDNTNTQCWEAKPYVEMAKRYGVPVFFHRAEGNFQNTHGVPSDKVAAMKARLETLTVEGCLAAKAPWEK
jgi:predicted kinase